MLSQARTSYELETIKLGHNVLADYFAQDQYKVLDPAAKMLDDISGIAPKVPQT